MKAHQLRHLGLQTLRRAVQLSVCGLMLAVVLLSLYAHYRAARALDDLELTRTWKGALLGRIDRYVAGLSDPQAFLDGYKGTVWSMRIAGVDLTDPLAAVEMSAAAHTVYRPLLVSVAIPVVVTLLLGRVFCSWICPAGLLFELAGKLRKLLRLAELRPAEVHFSHRNKYLLLLAGLAVVAAVGAPIFALVYPPAVLSRVVHAWIFGTALTGMLVLLAAIVLFELFVSPRWWCRTMCPGGALYAVLGWPRVLRVRLDAGRCSGCRECEPVCEPGLNPVLESESIECDNCGVCIRHCPDGALRYTLGLPRRPSGLPVRPVGLGSRRTGRLKVLGAVLLALTLTGDARGHHILGLPHYSYSENYPQAPTLEYPATTGPYDVLLTCYPGTPVPGETANLAFYIKNRETGQPYEKPITVRVLQTFTFGDNREILPATLVQPFEVPHKLAVTFPQDGEFVVELTLDVEGQPETIPFMVIAGQPSATASVLIAAGCGLVVFLVVVRAIRIKRARRAAAAVATPGRVGA